jgi:hypothetical protein
MGEELQFVARRLGWRADGGTLQGVRNLSQDRVQDLRSLSGAEFKADGIGARVLIGMPNNRCCGQSGV